MSTHRLRVRGCGLDQTLNLVDGDIAKIALDGGELRIYVDPSTVYLDLLPADQGVLTTETAEPKLPQVVMVTRAGSRALAVSKEEMT